MRKGWRPSAVIFFKTGPNAFLLIAVAGLKSGKNSSVTLFCAHFTGYACLAPFRISDLSCHLSTRKMRCAADRSPSSITRDARSISMSRPLKEGIHLERLARRKTAASGPSIPSGSPTSLTLFRLHRSSISVIFSVSRSSWSFKSVTVRLSSRAAAWTESTRSRVCFVLVTMASNSSLSSLTDLLVASMSSRSSRNAGISTESTASLTAEFTTEFKVLWCSLNASSMRLAIALSSSSLEMAEFWIFLHWRLLNLPFPISFVCLSTHDGSNAEWFKFYWQDREIFGKVSASEKLSLHHRRGSRDPPILFFSDHKRKTLSEKKMRALVHLINCKNFQSFYKHKTIPCNSFHIPSVYAYFASSL